MTGLEVLQRLRSGGDPVGVIMITAARELDTVSGALDGGAADYLIKPFEFPQLQAKLDSFAARADALASGGRRRSITDRFAVRRPPATGQAAAATAAQGARRRDGRAGTGRRPRRGRGVGSGMR